MNLEPVASSLNISVVIATRNRHAHLLAAVQSLEKQTLSPTEIIIVDASDDKEPSLKNLTSQIPLKWISAKPSVCSQRNIGIQSASSDWIFLCDDDIELNEDYFERLVNHARQDNSTGALSGLLLQKENGEWIKNYPVKSFQDLVWRFIFQHSVWGEVQVKAPWIFKPLQTCILTFYKQRKNSLSLAGWPLITDWSGSVIKTRFFSLGANLIRKAWLLQTPFDESLDAHGIGDNYGVAQGFPGEFPIHIVTSTFAYHHRALENRVDQRNVRYLRIIALHYFLTRQKAKWTTKLFFSWSVFGHLIYCLIKDRKNLEGVARAFLTVLANKNSYAGGKT